MKFECSIAYHSKTKANVKKFDKQTDKRTNGQVENHMPLIYRCGDIKRCTDYQP